MTETRTITISIRADDREAAAIASEDLLGHLYSEWATAHPDVKAQLAVEFTNGQTYVDSTLVA